MRLGNYLKEEITENDAKSFFKSLNSKLKADITHKPEMENGWWVMEFRADRYFTQTKADDDFPEFTGKKEVEKIVKRILPKTFEHRISAEEKGWIVIEMKKK